MREHQPRLLQEYRSSNRDIQAAEFAGYSVDSNKPRKQLEMV
jgi:hypothetical protein